MRGAEGSAATPSAGLWGLGGGLVAGALDVVRVGLLDRLDAGVPAFVADAVMGALPAALVGAVVGVALARIGWRSRRATFAAGFAGVVVVTVVAALLLPATPYGRTLPADPFAKAPPASAGPNVLLVTLDGVRADRFETARVTTTATSRVAVEGVRFRSTWAQVPYNGPSYATLHTGSAPWDHGVWLDGVRLPDDRATLAEVMAASGRDTGAFVSRGSLSRGLGFERGFRVYDDDLAWAKGAERLAIGRLWVLLQRGRPGWLEERNHGAVVDRALAWMGRREGPWFAWVEIGDALAPYEPPPPYDTRYVPDGGPTDPAGLPSGTPPWVAARHPRVTDTGWLAGLYDGEVAAADREVARLLDALDARGLAAGTLVVVTAPHGTALGEEGRWFRHDGISEGEVRVPFVARWPGRLPAGVSVEEPVEVGDIAPTIVEWLGLAAPASWTGASAAGVAAGGPASRAVARSVAFEPGGDGAWRVAAVRSRRDAWVHWERPGVVAATPEPSGAPDAERALLRDLLAERARDVLRGWSADGVRRPSVSPATAKWLDAQGAVLAP